MKNLLKRLLEGPKEKVDRKEEERRQLVSEMRGQLLKLKEKGLSIPVFTL